jgi:hypothetical protein
MQTLLPYVHWKFRQLSIGTQDAIVRRNKDDCNSSGLVFPGLRDHAGFSFRSCGALLALRNLKAGAVETIILVSNTEREGGICL